VNRIVGDAAELTEFSVDAVTEGINAVGAVAIRVQERIPDAGADGTPMSVARPIAAGASTDRRPIYNGYGVDTDIIVASARAYVAAVNKLLHARASEPCTTAAPQQSALQR
jgi:2-isopropylmalate synthase